MGKILRISIEQSMLYTNSLAIKPDKDGFFNVIVGATNVHNTSGDWYIHNDHVKKLFAKDSEMSKRVGNGEMLSEKNHPMPVPGMSNAEYLKRVYFIDPDNTCGLIKDLRLSNSPVNVDGLNTKVYLTYAKIKPTGPHGDALYQSFISDDSNTAFSVRSITIDELMPSGRSKKLFKYIINYDWVHAPGIAMAKASYWKSFGMESSTTVSIDITKDDISKLTDELKGLGLEGDSSAINALKDMFKSCDTDECIYKQWQ